MFRTHLSRALLAALAVAALASGSTLVTSSVAEASSFKIDPGFNRRIDPGFGRGPERVDPGFNRDVGPKYTVKKTGDFRPHSNSGPQYEVKKTGDFQLHSNCVWFERQGNRGSGGPRPSHPGPNGKGKICF
jgi:hypothetical protein